MSDSSLQPASGGEDERLDVALARWSADPNLAGLAARPGALLLVLDEGARWVLHASTEAAELRAAVADPEGRIPAAIDLAGQIRRLSDELGRPRLVRLRLDARGLAAPVACLVARAPFEDGRGAILVAPTGPMPRLRPLPERPDRPLPTPQPQDAAAPAIPLRAAGSRPGRFVWRSDAAGVIREVAGGDGAVAAALIGRTWDSLVRPDESEFSALREGRTFRALPLTVMPADGTEPVGITVSGVPAGRPGQPFSGFSGFGIVGSPPAVREAATAIADGTPSAPDAARRADLSVDEHAAFREIARALGARFAGDEEHADAPARSAAVMAFPAPAIAPQAAVAAALAAALEHLPAGVAIHRGSEVLFANRRLLDLTRQPDLPALRAAGGLSRFGLPGEPRRSGDEGVSTPSPSDGPALLIDRSTLDWEGAPAEIVLVREAPSVAPIPAAPEHRPGAAESEARHKLDRFARAAEDLRAPIGSIVAAADAVLAERSAPLGSRRSRDDILGIRESGGRALELLNDLVELARLEAGEVELAFADLRLNDVVSGCVDAVRPRAARDRIVMRTSLSPDLRTLRADERSIRKAALSVLTNAIRVTEPGGQVIVSTTLAERGEVVLRVRDTGAGRNADETGRDAGSAGEPPPSEPRRAGALGLSLTRALVEANCGRLRVTSRKDEGTLVEMLFPPREALRA